MVDFKSLCPGDKVKVVDKPAEGTYIVTEGMYKFLGQIVTIRSICDSHATIREDPLRFHWSAADFEYIDQCEDSFEAPAVEEFLASLSSLGYCAQEERRIL